MFRYAFWTCAKHFRVFKPQKQLVLFDNIYGQHSEKWPCMPSLWVKFHPILAKCDNLIQIDNIAHHWCLKYYHNLRIFDVEHWSYQTRQRGVGHGIVVFLRVFNVKLFFSNIFGKYTCWLLGWTVETLDFQIKGPIFACVEKNVESFLGQTGDHIMV